MTLWRITNYSSLDGLGSLKTSGRWHTRGRRIVYLSSSPSAALLEILVHLEIPVRDLPRRYKLLHVELPDGLLVQQLEEIPVLGGNWKQDQPATQRIGDLWLASNSAAILEVPSALVPYTSNFLLNPQHPDAARITITSISEHSIDE